MIVYEISGITVKMVCNLTFDNNYRFCRISKSYFLRKMLTELVQQLFHRTTLRMNEHKIYNIVVSI